MSCFLQLLQATIWGSTIPSERVTEEIFHEFENHAIMALVAPALATFEMQDALRDEWKRIIFEQVTKYYQYVY